MSVKRIKAVARPRRNLLPRENIQRQVDMLLTIGDVMRAFNVSNMTIHCWRRDRGLPAILVRGDVRDTVRFHPQEVLDWAKENRCTLVNRSALFVDRSDQVRGKAA